MLVDFKLGQEITLSLVAAANNTLLSSLQKTIDFLGVTPATVSFSNSFTDQDKEPDSARE